MRIPTATYRVQFRNGMTFDRIADHVPYLKRLGISHLYASPIFTATDGSTHGYDVTVANDIDPVIGGRPGFDRLVQTLKDHGLGLILDIVPNHMAASLENRWWFDVLELGQASAFARYFDIDWSRRVTVPVLDTSFEAALDGNEIRVETAPESGKLCLTYRGSFFPLSPNSYAGRADILKESVDREMLVQLHKDQAYELIPWRDVPSALSYRRFFEIAGLVGVRVEDELVFEDSHRLILELVRSGAVDGLRIDHVDGLTDPKSYLDRLRAAVGPDCYLTVEKILGEDEQLPADWPVSGTTGYEFISAISDALVDAQCVDKLRQRYELATGHHVDGVMDVHAAKRLLLENNFIGELARLCNLAIDAAKLEQFTLPEVERWLRAAVTELLVAFPHYRTYGTEAGLSAEDADLLETALRSIDAEDDAPLSQSLEFALRLLKGDVSTGSRVLANSFRARFQQLTGPLMAKSVEDTVFFRDNAALGLNEVGSEAAQATFSVARFHQRMLERSTHWPQALSATSTHDTKRGEDARARLYALTEMADTWADAFERWRHMNKDAVSDTAWQPEASVEWMLYQSLAGVWPTEIDLSNENALKAIEDRFVPYVEKALREAKLRTSWLKPNEAYESSAIAYARHLLSPDNRRFLEDFTKTIAPLVRGGFVNSLSQTVIKLMAPGVPDIYQGSEGLDLSLVDPDNRRQPDFSALESALSAEDFSKFAMADPSSWPHLKQATNSRLLRLRLGNPDLFTSGSYIPLAVSDRGAERVVAFGRTDGVRALVVIVPRHVIAVDERGQAEVDPSLLPDGEIMLPAQFCERAYTDVWTTELVPVEDSIRTRGETGSVPFIILISDAPAG